MASRGQPRCTIVANSAIARAPPAIRAVAAAMGVQPAAIRAFANGPEVPKVTAEATAKAIPNRKVLFVFICNPPTPVMSKIIFGPDDATEEGGQGSNAF